MSLSLSGTPPAGLEWTLAYPPSQISAVGASAAIPATAAGKTISCASALGQFTCLLTGLNTKTLPSGVVANIQLTLAGNATTTEVIVAEAVAVDAVGNGLSVLAGTSAIVTIPAISSLSCNPGTLNAGATTSCAIALNVLAPVGGSTVTLTSNNTSLTVPPSVTVTAGSSTATFSATAASSIPSNQSATVTAALNSSSQSAAISLLAPAQVSSVACTPTSLGSGSVGNCSITLTRTAPTGGSTVALASNNTSLTVPPSVTVTAGTSAATFSTTAASSIAINQSAAVTVALNGSSQSAAISLLAPAQVSSLACNSPSLGQSATSTCTVTLTQPAPAASPLTLVHVTDCGPQVFPGAPCTVPSTGSGNLIVVGFQAYSSGIVLSSITDNAGNTYTEAGPARSIDAAQGVMIDIWYAKNSVAGATAITITPSAAVSGSAAVIWEFSGADPAAPLDQTAVLNSQDAAIEPSGAPVAIASQSEVVISLADVANQLTGIVPGSPFIEDSTLLFNGWSHLVTSSAGAWCPRWNQDDAGTYGSSTASFRAATGATVTLTGNNPSLAIPASVTVAPGATTATFSATAAPWIATNQSAAVTATIGASTQNATISLVAPLPALISSLACNPTSLGPGSVSNCSATLTQTAPAGGSTVTLASNNASLTVPASVTVTAGTSTASFSATAASSIVSNQSATVTAALNGSSHTAAISLLAPVLVSSLACNPTTLGPGSVSNCSATLTQTAPAGGSTVTLASNNASLTVPASITVVAGASTASFSATAASSIVSNQSAAITAALNSSSTTAAISLLAPVQASNVACSPTSLGPGVVSSCSVTLTRAAAAHGSSVSLASNSPLLTVPASVAVPPGATTASFSATAASSLASNQTATVTAALGSSSQTVAISLLAPVLVSGLTCDKTGVMSGAATTCLITLSQAVSANTTVLLSSSSALLAIPATLTVPAGSSVASAVAVAGAIPSDTPAVLSATFGASLQSATVMLWSTPSLSSLTCTPALVVVGATSTCTVALSKAAGNLAVGLSSASSALAFPATVTVPLGSSSANFVVTGRSVAPHGATVTASYNGATQLAALVVTASLSPSLKPSSPPAQLKSISCKPKLLLVGAHGICRIEFEAPSGSTATDLQLTSSNQSVRLPAAVTIRPGQSSAGFRIDVVSPSNDDSAAIVAQLGATMVQETVSIDSRYGQLNVPAHINARVGAQVQFHVSSPDPAAILTASGLPAGAVFDAASGVFDWVPDAAQQGRRRIVFSAVDPAGDSVTASAIVEVDSGEPFITRVVNAASRSEEAACSPGAIASLEGRWLAEGQATSDPTGSSTDLSGTVVRVNGIIAPILSVSPLRVDFLCPAAVPESTLEVALQTPIGVALPIHTVSRQTAPGIFSIDQSGTGQGMILHAGTATMAMTPDYRHPSRAALPGEPLTIYATGIDATLRISVAIGGTEVEPQLIIASPGLAGIYQVVVSLPDRSADGDIPVSLKIAMPDGSTAKSNEVSVAAETSHREPDDRIAAE